MLLLFDPLLLLFVLLLLLFDLLLLFRGGFVIYWNKSIYYLAPPGILDCLDRLDFLGRLGHGNTKKPQGFPLGALSTMSPAEQTSLLDPAPFPFSQ